jgi:hypothetical protein
MSHWSQSFETALVIVDSQARKYYIARKLLDAALSACDEGAYEHYRDLCSKYGWSFS